VVACNEHATACSSQNVPRQVLVLDDFRQHFRHVRVVDRDGLLEEIGSLERDLVEQLLHHRVQSARADVLGPFVHDGREVGDAANRVVGKREVDPLGVHQRGVLLDQRAARLGENADELLFAERMELDPDRKASLQFRNEVRR